MTKNICLFLLGLALACKPKPETNQESALDQPNIILILADDMGYSDLSCTGGEIPTPHLDRLAADGILMANFYNASRCCPTRASLMTGLYPHQAGMGDMVEGRLWHDSTFLPAYQGWIDQEATTLAEALQQVNYHTYISGKWHLGNDTAAWPDHRGFEHTFTMLHGAGNYFNLEPWISEDQFMRLHLDQEPYQPEEDFYMTTAVTDHALNFIKSGSMDQPFFLYLSYTAPHWPLHARPEDINKFKGNYLEGWTKIRQQRFQNMIGLGLLPSDTELSEPYYKNPNQNWDQLSSEDKELWDLRMAIYAAQIYRMDQDIGRLVSFLEQRGQLDNTLIMFLSDNGATQAGIYQATSWVADRSGPIGSANSFDSYGGGWANASNVPYRLFKHWTTEGGIKTPFILHWPDRVRESKIVREYGHIIDIMPTCLAAAGMEADQISIISAKPMEGIDLLQTIEKPLDTERPLFWEHQGHWAVRKGHWKLVYTDYKDQISEAALYNLENDPAEVNDVKQSNPEKARELQQLYQQWADRVGVVPFDSLILARGI